MILLWALLALPFALALIPVRYHATAAVSAGNRRVAVTVTYLLRLFRVSFEYRDGKTHMAIYIAGMDTARIKRPKRKKKVKTPEKPAEAPAGAAPPERTADARKKTKAVRKKGKAIDIRQWAAVLTYPELKIIIGLIMRFLNKLARAAAPKRMALEGTVGFSDPCTTGWFMGAYEAAAGALHLRRQVRLRGSYERPLLALEGEIAGRLSFADVAGPVLWLCSRRPVFNLIKIAVNRNRKGEENG